jgi:HAMP domain-containing protein
MQPRKFTSSHVEELKKKRRKIFKIKVIIFSVLFLILLVGLYFLSKWNEINISKIEISGNKVLDAKVLEEQIQKEINGKYLWLFTKTNFVLVPRSKIKKELTENFRRIETISFDLSDSKTLKVEITERTPVYTWCGELLPDPTLKPETHKCQFMDYEGYVFDDAPYFSGDAYFRFYGPLEEYYFAKNDFNNFILFISNLEHIGIDPISLLTKSDDEIEIYLSSNTPPPNAPKIILNKKIDFLKIYQNLEAAIKTDPLKTEFQEKYSSLLYLDLRFVNKVYYKFKE